MFIRLFFALLIASANTYANDANLDKTVSHQHKHQWYIVEGDVSTLLDEINKRLSKIKLQKIDKTERIFEIYYDTPEFHYLTENGFVRYHAVQYLTKRKKKVKYHEEIQYSSDGISSSIYPVKHYKKVKNLEEKHSLLGMVKRKSREEFIRQMTADGIEYPMRMKSVFHTGKISYQSTLLHHRWPVLVATVSQLEITSTRNTLDLALLEIEILPLGAGGLNDAEVSTLQLFHNNLDGLNYLTKIDFTNEYSEILDRVKVSDALFSLNFKHPALINFVYAIVTALFGTLILYVLFLRNRRDK